MFPDGRRVVSSCSVTKNHKPSYTPGLDGYGNVTDSSSDSEYEYEGEIKVWDVVTGECVATLKGHSVQRSTRHLDMVRCGVHCAFVMMCLRRRSRALPCFRTGGASFLRLWTGRSRCGTWRPANAWRRWKGTRMPCVAASTVLL